MIANTHRHRQTDRQIDTLITILRPLSGRGDNPGSAHAAELACRVYYHYTSVHYHSISTVPLDMTERLCDEALLVWIKCICNVGYDWLTNGKVQQ